MLSLTEYAFLSANASPYKIINHKMPNAGNLGMAGTALRLYRHIHSSEEPSEGESFCTTLTSQPGKLRCRLENSHRLSMAGSW